MINSPAVLLVPDQVFPHQHLLLTATLPRLAGGRHEILADFIEPIVDLLGQYVVHSVASI